MFRKTNQPVFFQKARLLIAVLLLICTVMQIVSGVQMLRFNSDVDVPQKVIYSELEDRKDGEKISCRVYNSYILYSYTEQKETNEEQRCLVLKTAQNRITVLFADRDNAPDEFYFMEKVMDGSYDFLDFEGTVRQTLPQTKENVRKNVPSEVYEAKGMSEKEFAPVFVECAIFESAFSVKEIVLTFLGALLLLILMWFVLSTKCSALIIKVLKKSGRVNIPQNITKEDLPVYDNSFYTGYEESAETGTEDRTEKSSEDNK